MMKMVDTEIMLSRPLPALSALKEEESMVTGSSSKALLRFALDGGIFSNEFLYVRILNRQLII